MTSYETIFSHTLTRRIFHDGLRFSLERGRSFHKNPGLESIPDCRYEESDRFFSSFVAANKTTTAANAIILQYLAPAFTAILGVIILKENIRREQLIALMLTPVGMALLFLDRLVIMFHVTLVSMAYQVALVLVGNKIVNRLKTLPLARRLATRIAGVALVGFGIKLAINNR